MSGTTQPDTTAATQQAQHRDLVSRAKLLWRRNREPDALAFLQQHNSVRKNRALALEIAYEEYCIRRDTGEQIDVSQFCQQFPSISRSLYRQLEVDDFMRRHPGISPSANDSLWPDPGDRLVGFTVVQEIGRGAFARAYLCSQPGLGNRQVVVKVSTGGHLEANTMGGLDHPNIMPIYSVDEDSESEMTLICMPFVGRSTLFDVIDVAFADGEVPRRSSVILEASRALARRGDRYHRVTSIRRIRNSANYVTSVLQIVLQLADALAHAHGRGIVHGDMKPSNVVMSTSGVPMIVDFNLAQNAQSIDFVTGGTLPYMSPEQIRVMLLGKDDEDRVDERSDVFSLGVILYELLVGRTPFGATAHAMEPFLLAGEMLDSQSIELQSVRRLNPMVDARVADLVRRCLAFEPDERPGSMEEVAQDLRRFVSISYRTRRFLNQHRRALAMLAILTFSAGIASAVWLHNQPPRAVIEYKNGLEAYEDGDFHVAINRFNTAIEQTQPSSNFNVANIYFARGCAELRLYHEDQYVGWLESANQDLIHAARHDNHVDVREVRAYLRLEQGEVELAVKDYEKLVHTGDATAAIWNNLGYCYEKSCAAVIQSPDEYDALMEKAELAYREALRTDPDAAVPLFNFAFFELKRFRRSNRFYIPREGYHAIVRAIELGEADSVTYLTAAKLAGIIADRDNRPELFHESLDYLEHAYELNYDFSTLSLQSSYPFSLMLDFPKMRELIARKTATPNPRSPILKRVIPPRLDPSQPPRFSPGATTTH